MKILFFSAFMVLGLASINAQVASASVKSELVPTKKYAKTTTVKKKDYKKKYSSLKRTVKIICEEKELEVVVAKR